MLVNYYFKYIIIGIGVIILQVTWELKYNAPVSSQSSSVYQSPSWNENACVYVAMSVDI
jgi:hypothetical protein